MVSLVQRVGRCVVRVHGESISSIGRGRLILLAVHRDDTEHDLRLLVRKCAGLRIFPDDVGKMNRALADIGGEAMVVSQFTLFGDIHRGLRPYFGEAADPVKAETMYKEFMTALGETGIPVKGGVFGAFMQVELVNDGPVTIWIDSKEIA
jgi:D-aminoacyl-tRNA deacylase